MAMNNNNKMTDEFRDYLKSVLEYYAEKVEFFIEHCSAEDISYHEIAGYSDLDDEITLFTNGALKDPNFWKASNYDLYDSIRGLKTRWDTWKLIRDTKLGGIFA